MNDVKLKKSFFLNYDFLTLHNYHKTLCYKKCYEIYNLLT